MWKLIEQKFDEELDKLIEERFPPQSVQVFANICFGIQHHTAAEGDGISKNFWRKINTVLR